MSVFKIDLVQPSKLKFLATPVTQHFIFLCDVDDHRADNREQWATERGGGYFLVSVHGPVFPRFFSPFFLMLFTSQPPSFFLEAPFYVSIILLLMSGVASAGA